MRFLGQNWRGWYKADRPIRRVWRRSLALPSAQTPRPTNLTFFAYHKSLNHFRSKMWSIFEDFIEDNRIFFKDYQGVFMDNNAASGSFLKWIFLGERGSRGRVLLKGGRQRLVSPPGARSARGKQTNAGFAFCFWAGL